MTSLNNSPVTPDKQTKTYSRKKREYNGKMAEKKTDRVT